MSKFIKVFTRQIPSFIRDEYPKFVEFIHKYFEFVDEESFSSKDIHDLEYEFEGVKVFLEALRKEIAYNVPRPVVDEATLLQKVKELYVTKGSEEALRFIFRAFFNKEIEIFLPSSQILKPSDGQWMQDYSIFVRRIVGDPYNTIGKKVTVFNKRSKITLEVIRVNETVGEEFINVSTDFDLGSVTDLIIERSYELGFVTDEITDILQVETIEESYFNVYHELIIDRNYSGTYEVGDVVEFFENGVWYMGYIVPTITKYEVLNGGKGFRVGQTIDIVHDGDPDGATNIDSVNGIGCRLKVSRIGEGGSIQAVQMIKYGVEYPKSFMINVASNPVRVISKIYYDEMRQEMEFTDRITRYSSRGYVMSDFEYSGNSGALTNVDIVNGGSGYSHPKIIVTPSLIGDHAVLFPVFTGGILTDVIIHKSGSGYDSCSAVVVGGDYVERARITPVILNGSVVDVQIDHAGLGYLSITIDISDSPTLDNAEAYPVVEDGKIVDIFISKSGSGYISDPTITLSGDGVGSGAILNPSLSTLYYSVIEYFGNMDANFSYTVIKRDDEYDGIATIKLVSGAVAKYPGYYNDNKGFVSDSVALIDSRYYQDFSYVIRSTIPYEEYAGTVLSLTHLAGTKMFAEYALESVMDISVEFINKTNFRYEIAVNDSFSVIDNLNFTGYDTVDPIILSDTFTVEDTVFTYDNPYSNILDNGESDYFAEDYSEGDTPSPTTV